MSAGGDGHLICLWLSVVATLLFPILSFRRSVSSSSSSMNMRSRSSRRVVGDIGHHEQYPTRPSSQLGVSQDEKKDSIREPKKFSFDEGRISPSLTFADEGASAESLTNGCDGV